MKRFHVPMADEKLDSAVAFYQNLFGQPPAVLKHDDATWMLDDPRVNFAISSRVYNPEEAGCVPIPADGKSPAGGSCW